VTGFDPGPVPVPAEQMPECGVCHEVGLIMGMYPQPDGTIHYSCLDRVACYQRMIHKGRYDCPVCGGVGSAPTHRRDCPVRPAAADWQARS